mmetsp:Transcript_14873/g.22541  ORF Transcript_14873/g.22541 Transcript_14873/m.22541 type:complete len:447 (+) Transcript_14873:157-1497(+)
MFTLASGFYENYLIPPEVSLLIVGLDNSGKTTLLERLKVTDFKSEKQALSGKRISVKPVKEGGVHDRKTGNGNTQNNASVRRNDVPANDDGDGVMVTKEMGGEDSNKLVAAQRRRFICPSPREYEKDQQEYVFDGDSIIDQPESEEPKNRKGRNDSARSLSSVSTNHSGIVPIHSSRRTSIPPISPHPPISKNNTFEDHYYSNQENNPSTNNTTTKTKSNTIGPNEKKRGKAKNGKDQKSYDQKPGTKMFPLHLIRPTVGMNLAKFDACKAKVRVMDLGGSSKMRNLWERYYCGIHGVAFIVDVSKGASVAKLMEARAFYRCMLDDDLLKTVPVIVFANKIDDRSDDQSSLGTNGDKSSTGSTTAGEGKDDELVNDGGLLGDTSLLDIAELFLSPPRGSDSLSVDFQRITMFAGSAKTGEGVRPAFEWLIRMGTFLAKAQRRSSVH